MPDNEDALPFNRRKFLHRVGSGVATGFSLSPTLAQPAAQARIRALAFDAFPIFDPRPVFALAEELFPGKGAELSNVWRTRQFEYTWLRTVAGHYADFRQVTEDALIFAAQSLRPDLGREPRRRLMDAYAMLKAWPDVPPALAAFKAAGLRLAFLSNFTPQMLETAIRNSGLENYFAHILSTDRVRTYKPDPRAYQMAPEAFRLKREEILFVPFAGWDAAGARWFGFPTFWVNRLKAPAEELGIVPDASGENLSDLAAYVKAL